MTVTKNSKSKAPKLTKAAMEKSLLEVGDVKTNFPIIESILFDITHIKPAENTVDSRLRCAFTSANSKFISKVIPKYMEQFKDLINAKFNLVMSYPMELLSKHIDEISDDEFDKRFKEPEDNVEDVIKEHGINNIESFKAYQRFTSIAKRWPDYYDAEYVLCGMIDEFNEFIEASAKDQEHELGDVLWYYMSICHFWSASDEELNEIIGAGDNAKETIDYKLDERALFHKFVKMMRDEPHSIGNFTSIFPIMKDIWCSIILMARGIDNLNKIALGNIAKIRNRISNNTISGNGEERDNITD